MRLPRMLSPSRTRRTEVASAVVWNVTIMRRRDFRGEKVWIWAWAFMAWVMLSRFEEVKIWGFVRFVIRRVLDGGEGVVSWGRVERSRERFWERQRVGGGSGDIVMVAMG